MTFTQEIFQLYAEFQETNNPLTELILIESLMDEGFTCETKQDLENIYDEIQSQMG